MEPRGLQTLTMEVWRLKMEPWKTCGQVVADLQHFDKDPDLSENSDQDPHLSEKMDTDPHLFKILSPGTTVNYLRAQPNNH
jgi:hypothetical protein